MSVRRVAERLFYWSLTRVMAAPPATWDARVLPHGPIEELAPGLWHVTGAVPPRALFPREMLLYRLPDRALLVHSAIALAASGMTRLESLGRPGVLLVPNPVHRIDAAAYKHRYPELRVICPAAARAFVEQVVPVDGTAEGVLPGYGIRCHEPRGVRFPELAYELPLSDGRALVFTDVLFNMDAGYLRRHVPPHKRLVLWLDRLPAYLGITLLYRLLFLEDSGAFRRWLEELAARLPDLRVICVGHGSPIRGDCAWSLREAARGLGPQALT